MRKPWSPLPSEESGFPPGCCSVGSTAAWRLCCQWSWAQLGETGVGGGNPAAGRACPSGRIALCPLLVPQP